MKRHVAGLLLATASVAAGSAQADALPDPVRAMIEAAGERRDPAVLQAVVSIARQTSPEHAAEIDALAASYADAGPREPSVEPQVVAMGPPALVVAPPSVLWKGAFELGGSQVSGSSDVVGVYGAIDLSRKADRWTHKLNARADYQKTGRDTTTDRVTIAYQPQFHLGPRLYSYGLGQYDHDRSLGIETRYTVGAGLGVTASDGSQVKIALDAGPAIRRTRYSVLEDEESLAGRASLNIKWLPTERVTVAQELATFAERGRLNTKSTTALDTRLFGPLKARLSYNLLYERDEPRQRTELETTSRATLLYSF